MAFSRMQTNHITSRSTVRIQVSIILISKSLKAARREAKLTQE